jgi:hypothetical protein
MMTLRCDSHGKLPWTGQVICALDAGGCGAVWHLNIANPPTESGDCTCGKALVGPKGTARAICAQCYTERAKVA